MSSFFFLSPLVRLCHTFAEQTCLNSLYPIQSSSKILGDFLKIAYSRINSVMCSSVHFDNYIELPQYHTKLFFLKLPVQPLGTQSTTTLNPWEQTSLCHPYNSTFSRISYTWNHIISEISLEVWFLSLSKMHLRSIHVDTWINVCSIFFFFFLGIGPLGGCTMVCLSIHLDIWVVFRFGLLWIKVLEMLVYKFLC